jgi:transposase-like protein
LAETREKRIAFDNKGMCRFRYISDIQGKIGVTMYLQATTTYGSLIPGSEYIRSLIRQGTISKDAAKRLRWMDHYAEHGIARLTCRYFGISAQTFYRWKSRYDPYDLTTLEEISRRPHRVRLRETPEAVESRILELR